MGVSVRTLHHYDQIGLLQPKRDRENDYRKYSDEDMDKLQQILFFRECGFSLKDIKKLLNSPDFDKEKAFNVQKKYLLHEKKRIEVMQDTLEKTMKVAKGEMRMSQKEKFAGFDMSHNPYEEEARKLWGEGVEKSNAQIRALSKKEQKEISLGMDGLFTELAAIRHEKPDSPVVKEAMEKMFAYFNRNFGYAYTPEAFAQLGQMYVSDKRFTENIDAYGSGLAKFLSEAMGIYGKTKQG
ncbi:MAG: MerR family transcriptional regulator [Clostridiales bacterium]|nr:MerR family transcriptional regulator [Clostridiales bacterium]